MNRRFRAMVAFGSLAIVLASDAWAEVRTRGTEVRVGAWRLTIQVDQRRVVIAERRGDSGPAVRASSIVAQFVGWDPNLNLATISVAFRNIGLQPLFGPLHADITGLSNPRAIPVDEAMNIMKNYSYGEEPLEPGAPTLIQTWRFFISNRSAMTFRIDVDLLAGVPLAGGEGATVVGTAGVAIVVPPGALPYDAFIKVERTLPDSLLAPIGDLRVVGAATVTLRPISPGSDPLPLREPLQLTIDLHEPTAASQFIIAREELVDSIDAPGVLVRRFMPVDTGTVIGNTVQSSGDVFDGITGGGVYAVFENTGSGFARGVVRDPSGPRSGVVVSNNTNRLVSSTNALGQYVLYISGGPFVLSGFDPFRASVGTASGTIVTSGTTVIVDLTLVPLVTPVNTRDGVRNGGFEVGNLSAWFTNGAATVRQTLGPTSSGVVIAPTEGEWMGDINTGEGSINSVGSSIRQRFRVPAGVRTLRIDYNFVSEEFPEFVNSRFDDAFRATITTPDGSTTFAEVRVNASSGFSLIGDCFFPGGDLTCGQTGWRTGSVDLSNYAGIDIPIDVELLFAANDAGDNIYDTHVLVDNVRFSTVWLDIKTLSGSTANDTRIRTQLARANEILSQAGINVRMRSRQSLPDPGGLSDLDIASQSECRPFLLCLVGGGETRWLMTPEETQLFGLSRSTTDTDVNAYYTSSNSSAAFGAAITPEDFWDVTLGNFAGLTIADSAMDETLAHEIGHLLLSQRGHGNLEHNVSSNANFMHWFTGVTRNQLSRAQSADINRAGASFLRP